MDRVNRNRISVLEKRCEAYEDIIRMLITLTGNSRHSTMVENVAFLDAVGDKLATHGYEHYPDKAPDEDETAMTPDEKNPMRKYHEELSKGNRPKVIK